MKKILLAFVMLFQLASVFADDKTLANNFCTPLKDSKRYLSTDFSIKYPRLSKFECTYSCKVNGVVETVVATSSVVVNSMEEDAKNVVCQGVIVKEVPWGYDFDRLEPFYAFDSKLIELKRWAFENLSQNNATEKIFLEKLKKDLNTVGSSFIIAGINGGSSTSYFLEAGQRLSAIAAQLPNSTILLDEVIKQIIVNKNSNRSAANSDSLVMSTLSTAASWRIPAR